MPDLGWRVAPRGKPEKRKAPPSMAGRAIGATLAAASFLALLLLGVGCREVHFRPGTKPGEIRIFDDLFSVSAPDADHVVAVGYWGTAYYTEDGGKSWKKGETGTTRLLYDVSMADALRGWAVGQLGLILRTEDGGRTWTPQPNPKAEQGTHLFGVYAIDANTAWAVGEWGTRIFTDDGGKSWQDRSLTIDKTNPQFVWLSPFEQEKVLRGEKVFEDVGLNDVSCLPPPSRSCWIVGEFGYIFRSENLGQNWERGEILGKIRMEPIVLGYNEIELHPEHIAALERFAAQIVDLQHLNVEVEPVASAREVADFGKEEDPSELFDLLEARTEAVVSVLQDAGLLSDRIRKRGTPPWDYEDFLDTDPDFLHRYLRGRIADQPGVRVRVVQNPYLFSVRFENEELGFISGLGGVVLKSNDGGRSWAYRETGRKQALFSVYPVGERVLAVGEKGFVRVSEDSGEHFVEPTEGFPAIFTFMRDIDFAPDKKRGYIVGQRGLVLRSDDGGLSWHRIFPPKRARSGTQG